MNITAGRAPLARPAMPIDIAAPAYHSSALKMTRLIFFFAGRARELDFLALVADLEFLLFGIFTPTTPWPQLSHLSRGHGAVTVASKKSLPLYGGVINFLNI
jgi:hypothetical protein